ncbi:MAG: polyribonucleotide nucleotidyltransferase, partial [Flavobacteriales bacterium]
MNYTLHTKTIDLGDGKPITIETGKLAKQANGSVVVRMGDTMLLAAAVSNNDAKENVDFLPLTVDYREKYSAAGRFPGGFFKREARPSDGEVLTMRLVDRTLRPIFPDDYHADTQVMIQLISTDKENMPDALAGLAASAAIAVSDIPFNGPISEVRVGRLDGKFIINPTFTELEQCDMDMVIGGTIDNIVMVEGEMHEVSEEEMVEAIEAGHAAIKVHCQAQLELAAMTGKAEPKRTYVHETHNDELKDQVHAALYNKYYEIAENGGSKAEKKEKFQAEKEAFVETLDDEVKSKWAFQLSAYIKSAMKSAIRNVLLDKGIRLDNRATTEIRDIWSEVDYLPSTHGSAVFTRGETQSLTTLTLGNKLDEQMIDSALSQRHEKFLLHYNFPPFSTGEARP